MAVAACWECHVGEKLLGASAGTIALSFRCEATRSSQVLLLGLGERAIVRSGLEKAIAFKNGQAIFKLCFQKANL